MAPRIAGAHETLVNKSGAGNDFLGWIDLPVDYDKAEFDRVKAAAEKMPYFPNPSLKKDMPLSLQNTACIRMHTFRNLSLMQLLQPPGSSITSKNTAEAVKYMFPANQPVHI